MQKKPTLTYVNGRGNAERIRFVLAGANIDWDEIHLLEKDERLKLNDTLFGEQVPSLEIDGIVLTQSWTIIRYLSRTRSLEPADNSTWAKADMFSELLRTYDSHSGFVMFGWGERNDDIEKVKKASQRWIPRLEKEVDGNGYCFGDKHYYCDYLLLHHLLFAIEVIPNVLDNCPKLTSIKDKLLESPQFQSFLSSDKRKRQVDEDYKVIVRRVFH